MSAIVTIFVQGKGKGKKNARLDVAEKVLQYFKEHDNVAEKAADLAADEKSNNVCQSVILNVFLCLYLPNFLICGVKREIHKEYNS